MSLFGNNLRPDTITYWAPIGRDGFGKKQFDTPVTMNARYNTAAELNNIDNEEKFRPMVNCYTAEEVVPGGYIALGDHTAEADPLTVDVAFNIRQLITRRGINSTDVVYKALL
jgi:hypothetical protein